MHASIELKDIISEDGKPSMEVGLTIHDEMTQEVIDGDPSPTIWAANAILFLFQTGQIANLIEAYQGFIASAGEPSAQNSET